MKLGNNSSAAVISRAYAVLLVCLMTVMSLAIASAVGWRLVKNKHDDSQQLMTVLQRSFVNDKPDWNYWRDTAAINTRNTFVRVQVTDKDGNQQVFYSRHAQKFLKDTLSTWPIMKNVQYQEDQGLFYHVQSSRHLKDGSKESFDLWLTLNNMLEMFRLILTVVIIITALGFLIGIWLISLMAKRLNRPLVALTEAAQTIVETRDVTYHETLPVADSPSEVHDLSIEFNRLLHSLNEQVIRDHQFVSDASHELRTPLAAIRGHVSLIRRHAKAHPEIVPTSLATIDDESLKMQHLIESLLTLSRMDHAQLTLTAFDLSALVKTVAARFAPQFQRELTVHAPQEAIVQANAESIEQVILALLSNAVKYSPQGSPITLTVQIQEKHVYVTVADLGSGVPDADKQKIFDRFYREDASRSKKIAGNGLGLAIVSRQLDLNNASILVTDNVPYGSRFTVKLNAMGQTKPAETK